MTRQLLQSGAGKAALTARGYNGPCKKSFQSFQTFQSTLTGFLGL